ncbi:hypothetical protein ACJX0J_017887 [Zea mays]
MFIDIINPDEYVDPELNTQAHMDTGLTGEGETMTWQADYTKQEDDNRVSSSNYRPNDCFFWFTGYFLASPQISIVAAHVNYFPFIAPDLLPKLVFTIGEDEVKKKNKVHNLNVEA